MDAYNTSVHQALDNHTPLKTGRVPMHSSTPWIGEEVHEAKRAVHPAWKLANHSKLTVHKEIFVKERNLL